MKTTGIVAFSFGAPESIRSNKRIARVSWEKSREVNAPIYTQFDVHIKSGAEVMYISEKIGNPSPTLRMARGAVRWAERERLTELLIVAAKPHLWRCERDLKEAAREIGLRIVVRFCEEVQRFPENEWFCLDSTQLRTRSRMVWRVREQILKLMPFFLYKYVAS